MSTAITVKGVHPRSHLADFTGLLQVDGYTGFNRVGSVELAFCWVHARRKFFEFHYATASPVAAEALRRIAELYQIEARIRGCPPDARARIRQAESRLLIDAMRTWLQGELGRISAKSTLAEAIRYALRHWQGLGLFLRPRPGRNRPRIPSSAPSGRSSSAPRAICSRVRTAGPKARQPSPR
jgi:hypothetical protein